MTVLDEPIRIDDPSVAPASLTVWDLAAMPDGDRYELEDGQLVERKQMALYEDEVTQLTSSGLVVFNVARGSPGVVFSGQTILSLWGRGKTGKKADVAYTLRDRLPANAGDFSVLSVPPDLIVEVVSPNDSFHDVVAKVELYLDAGVGEVWVIATNTRTLTRYWRDRSRPVELLRAGQTLTGDGPLAGLSLAVADLFPPQPRPTEPAV